MRVSVENRIKPRRIRRVGPKPTTSPTYTKLALNPGLRLQRPTTKILSHRKAWTMLNVPGMATLLRVLAVYKTK